MARFVESFATQQLLPPWQATGARIWSFAVRLSARRIEAYLQKYFNGAYPDRAPYHYAPLEGPQFGLLTICWFPNVATLNREPGAHPVSGGRPWDRIRHTEIYISFPVLRYAMTKDRLLTDPTLVWVEPVVYSDNDTIVFSSREIWGSDMYRATIVRDTDLPPDQLHLDAGIIGVKTFNPRSVEELLAFLHVRASETSPVGLQEILGAKPHLQAFADIVGGSGVFAGHHHPQGLRKSPYAGGVELNNLKQFRDAYDMDAATYRAIVASQSSYAGVRNVVIYDAAKVEIAFMWSDSVAEMLQTILGLSPPVDTGPPRAHADDMDFGMDWDMDSVTVRPELAFSYTADVTFRVLATIHTDGLAA